MSIRTRAITEQIELHVLVSHSLFSQYQTTDNGGVIYYAYTDNNNNVIPGIIVEFCSFRECSSSQNGGCIYVSAKCPCIVDFVCSYKCIATSYGQFIYLPSLTENTEIKNYIEHSSICSPDKECGNESPIRLGYGQKQCSYVNISNYKVKQYNSAIRYCGNTQTNSITYCTITNTHSKYNTCIQLETIGTNNNKIEQCEIVNNTQSNADDLGTIRSSSSTFTISQCCFQGNNATYLFFTGGTSPKITVTQCNIAQDYEYSGSVEILTDNNKGLSMNFASIPKDCSHIHLLRCNTKDCAKGAGNVLNLFGNLYVLSILITNK